MSVLQLNRLTYKCQASVHSSADYTADYTADGHCWFWLIPLAATDIALLQACPQPAYRTASRRSPAQQASQGAPMNSLMENMVTVQPHALDSHVPALCGPLQAGHSTSCQV